MGDWRLVCVADSTVWISLKYGKLIEAALSLPFQWLVPDVILEEELQDPSGAWLENRGVGRCELSGSQVETVIQMATRYRRPSRRDLFALVQAKEERAVLLTDDRPLREAASAEGVKVHGTLWLLDQMLAYKVISKPKAAIGLRQMVDAGRWLPKDEVKRRLRQWEGGG